MWAGQGLLTSCMAMSAVWRMSVGSCRAIQPKLLLEIARVKPRQHSCLAWCGLKCCSNFGTWPIDIRIQHGINGTTALLHTHFKFDINPFAH